MFEQERHSLQSQLTQRQAEYDNTVRDLQEDIGNLKEQLRHHDDEASAGQRRHVQDLRQVQQQNEALSEQLRQVSWVRYGTVRTRHSEFKMYWICIKGERKVRFVCACARFSLSLSLSLSLSVSLCVLT